MNRRGFLAGGAALASLAPVVVAAKPPKSPLDDPPADDLRTAAREGWIYGVPLATMAKLRNDAIGARPTRDTPGFNAFLHTRQPFGPGDRAFSAPEADLIYSSAWLHLPPEGAKFILPPTGGRHFSLGLFDMYGNAFQVVQGSEIGERGRSFILLGPPAHMAVSGYTAPMPRMPHLMGEVVHAPSSWVWALARIHVESEPDLALAHQLQDSLQIHVKPNAPLPMPPVSLDATWSDYFFFVQKLIEENPPPSAEIGFFRRIAPLQLSPAGDFEKARFADVDLGLVADGANQAQALAFETRAPADAAGGWVWPKPDVGLYDQDFLYRARTVLTQTAALPRSATMAIRAVAADGSLSFPSAAHYRLTLPGPPPAEGPWSLTLYEVGTDGRLTLTQNALGRHFLGAWTPGLKRREDGGIDIWIGRSDPGGAHTSNWLPAPDAGAFALILRARAPTDAMLERRYVLPPVETLGVRK